MSDRGDEAERYRQECLAAEKRAERAEETLAAVRKLIVHQTALAEELLPHGSPILIECSRVAALLDVFDRHKP